MEKGKEKHLFPGNNTPQGFFSYYEHILPQHKANHIFCLKGGPGVGKSTFMKRIGLKLQERGYTVEYLHCSSDPDSLDGIVIPKLLIAMIDGTAPHIVDPKNPGAVDEIINLGEYWNLSGIKQHKKDIINTNAQIGRLFKRAYRYIAAAKCIMDVAADMYWQNADQKGLLLKTLQITNEVFAGQHSSKLGRTRKMFASAITPDGIIHYLDTLFVDDYYIYNIKNHWGVGTAELLRRISDEAILRGINVEQFYCPMYPDKKIEHLIIPSLKIAFITQNRYICPERHNSVIDLAQYYDVTHVEKNKDEIQFDKEQFQLLLNQSINTIRKAKQLHDALEQYYIPNMDFDAVKEKMQRIINRILSFS